MHPAALQKPSAAAAFLSRLFSGEAPYGCRSCIHVRSHWSEIAHAQKWALQLALSATRLDRVEATSLGFDAISARLRESKARVVVLLDVCHAGVVDRAAAGTNDAAVSQLVTNSGASMVVLSASKGRQYSEETPKAAGGLFSSAFERTLTTDRTANDVDRNGAISISELYRGLKSSVVRASEGRQTPWLSRNRIVGDLDLF
jgi:hypothetical protein